MHAEQQSFISENVYAGVITMEYPDPYINFFAFTNISISNSL